MGLHFTLQFLFYIKNTTIFTWDQTQVKIPNWAPKIFSALFSNQPSVKIENSKIGPNYFFL